MIKVAHPPWAPILRSFRWGHVIRQLDRVSRELLAPGLAGRGGTDGDVVQP